MLRFCLTAVLLLSMIPAFASDPGQPLDCSDWELLQPGYSCSTWLAFPCAIGDELCWLGASPHKVFDNAGWQYFHRILDGFTTGTPCGDLRRYEIWRYNGSTVDDHEETSFSVHAPRPS